MAVVSSQFGSNAAVQPELSAYLYPLSTSTLPRVLLDVSLLLLNLLVQWVPVHLDCRPLRGLPFQIHHLQGILLELLK